MSGVNRRIKGNVLYLVGSPREFRLHSGDGEFPAQGGVLHTG